MQKTAYEMDISDWCSDVCSSDPAGRDAGALHQGRVALRRLRSAFSIFKPVIGGDAHTPLRDELRWLASELANARNLDVLLERAKPGALRDRIAASREAAYDAVGEVRASARVRALMRDLAAWGASGARKRVVWVQRGSEQDDIGGSGNI